MLICVLNLGLKSMRAAIFDPEGHRRAIAYRPITTRLGEGRVEQDPEDWWGAALEVLDEVLADRGTAASVGLVTVTASAGCLVTLDRELNALGDAIMISDVRAREESELIQQAAAFDQFRRSGWRVTPDLMLPKIIWLRDHEPARYSAARWFVSPNDYLIARLTGEVLTDRHNASKYLYGADDGRPELNGTPIRYPADLIRELALDLESLPPVAALSNCAIDIRPEIRSRLGLRDDTRVVVTAYDAICAVYGSGASAVGDACDVSGTVTSFRVVTDQAIADASRRLFVSPHLRPGLFLVGGSNNLGGGVIEWAKQLLYTHDPDPYGAMVADVSDAPPGAGGITFLPYLLGERAPIWDAEARGVFFGLGRSHRRSDLARAIFEGVGYSVLDIAERVAELGPVVKRSLASGGLAQLEPMLQIKADMLGVPVLVNNELETTALGAAIMAAVSVGQYASLEEATRACVRYSAEFEPQLERTAMYRDFFAIYRGLYDSLMTLFHDRNALIQRHAEVLRTVPSQTENL
jgi:sugar (pentulose or hexulose) kinase